MDLAAEKNHKRMKRDIIDRMFNQSSTSSEESSNFEETSYPCRTS